MTVEMTLQSVKRPKLPPPRASTNHYENQSVSDISMSDSDICDAPTAVENFDQTDEPIQEPTQGYVEVSVARLKFMYIIGGVLAVVTVILIITVAALASRSCSALSAATATSSPAAVTGTLRCACPTSSTTQASTQKTAISANLATDTTQITQITVHSVDIVTPAEIHKYPNSCRTAEPNVMNRGDMYQPRQDPLLLCPQYALYFDGGMSVKTLSNQTVMWKSSNQNAGVTLKFHSDDGNICMHQAVWCTNTHDSICPHRLGAQYMLITDNGQLIILNRLGHIIWMSGVGIGGKTITVCTYKV